MIQNTVRPFVRYIISEPCRFQTLVFRYYYKTITFEKNRKKKKSKLKFECRIRRNKKTIAIKKNQQNPDMLKRLAQD